MAKTAKQLIDLLKTFPENMEVKIQITDEEYNVQTASIDTYEVYDEIVLYGECTQRKE